MPNHVRSKITMKNITKKDIFSTNDDNERYLDFEKIIPMPEEIQNTKEDSVTYWGMLAYLVGCSDSINYYYRFMDNKPIINKVVLPTKERIKEVAETLNITVTELEEFGKQYIENARKYGSVSWYDWSNLNWGCKWNSYDLYEEDNDNIFISTPWAPPDGIFVQLSKDNPYDRIYVRYANEDPSIGGYLEYLDGELIDAEEYDYQSEDSVANYAELWGINYLEDESYYDYEEPLPAFSYNLIEDKGEKENG